MKILYLKGYKWLLPQNQRVRLDFLGYIQYEALTKHIKPFLKTLMWKDVSARTIVYLKLLFRMCLKWMFSYIAVLRKYIVSKPKETSKIIYL